MLKGRPHWRELADSLAPLASLVVLSVVLSCLTPHFLTSDNFLAVGVQTAVIAVAALGETLVIIAGGIDLSVGSVLGLAGVATAMAMRAGWGLVAGSLAGVAVGGACGFVNGLVTVKGRVPSFIVTLGMLGIARGIVLVATGGVAIYDVGSGLDLLGEGRIAGVPVPLWLVAILAVVLWVLLERTRVGRHLRAVGGNREAARLSGVPVDARTILVFTLSGVCAGLAGVLGAARVKSGQPTAGEGYELDAVAAAVIGGASLAGGEGGIAGTLIGAFLMGVLRNGCNLLNVEDGYQRVTIGILIVGAVFYDYVRRRRREGPGRSTG